MRHLTPLLLALSLSGSRVPAQSPLPPVEIFTTLPTRTTNVVPTLGGRRLYYTVVPNQGTAVGQSLWFYDVSAGRSTRVADGPFADMALSRNGDRIAFSRRSEDLTTSSIWTLPLDPVTGLVAGVAQQASLGTGVTLHFSPDGRFIAYRGSANNARRVSVIPVNGGIERVLADGMVRTYLSGWSGDGKWVYFVGQRTYEEPFRLQRASTVDGEIETVLENVGIDGASVSPDGAHISVEVVNTGYFALVDTSGTQLTNRVADEWLGGEGWLTPTKLLLVEDVHPRGLKTVSLSTGAVREIFATSYDIGDAAWSPDSKRVVAIGWLRGDSSRVMIADADGSNLRTIRVAGHPGSEVAWSPDGRWIAMHGAGDTSIVALDATTGRLEQLRTASDGRIGKLRWMPDSRRLRYVHWTATDSGPDVSRAAIRETTLDGLDKLLRRGENLGPSVTFASDTTIVTGRDSLSYLHSLTTGRTVRLQSVVGFPGVSQKGDLIGSVVPAPDAPKVSVSIVTLDGAPVARLTFPGALGVMATRGLRFTPDGQAVIASAFKPDGKCCSLYLAPLDGGPVRTLLDIPNVNATPVVWVSPDGQSVLATFGTESRTSLGAIDLSGVIRTNPKP